MADAILQERPVWAGRQCSHRQNSDAVGTPQRYKLQLKYLLSKLLHWLCNEGAEALHSSAAPAWITHSANAVYSA